MTLITWQLQKSFQRKFLDFGQNNGLFYMILAKCKIQKRKKSQAFFRSIIAKFAELSPLHVLLQYPWGYFDPTYCFSRIQIEATRNRKTGGLIVDSQPKLRQKAEGGPKSMKVKSPLYVGGLPDQVRTSIISEVSWMFHICEISWIDL